MTFKGSCKGIKMKMNNPQTNFKSYKKREIRYTEKSMYLVLNMITKA